MKSLFSLSTALSSGRIGAPVAINGVSSQVRYMSGGGVPYGPASRDLPTTKHKLHNDMEVPSFDDYRRSNTKDPNKKADDYARKNFTYAMTTSVGILGTYTAMSIATTIMSYAIPNRALALGAMEIDIGEIPEGKNMVLMFQGKPLFVRHRRPAEIETENAVDVAELRDPETDSERCKDPRFLICEGVCTHLGCVPISGAGEFGGYYCPCHGSHYDAAGRIRKGPAPLNLRVPKYKLEGTLCKLG